MLLTDQRLTTTYNKLNAILNIKINDKVFTEREKNEEKFLRTQLSARLQRKTNRED